MPEITLRFNTLILIAISSHVTGKSVTAILVAYNSAGIIGKTLARLLEESGIAHIIVVDNCSHDDTCELVQRDFPAVQLIENPRNEGFGRGNNAALGKVQTPYALLINPDAVLEEGAVSHLLEAAERYPDAAILAPRLYDATSRLHHSYKRNVFIRDHYRSAAHEPCGDLCAEFLSGAVWLANMSHLKTVGFFDPRIFLYYEDDDLCLRVRQAGYSLVMAYDARATHLMGASSGAPASREKGWGLEFFKQRHMIWSRLYIEEKYHGKKAADKLAGKLHAEYALKAAFYFATANRDKYNRYRGA